MPRVRTPTSARPRNWCRRRTPSAIFNSAVLKIGNYLIILAVALVAVIITVAIFRGDPILTTLQFALVLIGGRDSGGDADGVVGDDGGRRTPARQESKRL